MTKPSHEVVATVVEFVSPDPTSFIVVCSLIAVVWAIYQYRIIAQTTLDDFSMDRSAERASLKHGAGSTANQMEVVREVYQLIQEGARAFLHAEYTICLQFVVCFSILILVLIGW
jgi:Na+/H+-translocating membrane pyrophosphatase